jgi:AcrR family transcriptional regulator
MAPRTRRSQPINTVLQKGRKRTQRERIIHGMIAAAARDGYAGATVNDVVSEAGVSKPTFYEYFADRDECFLAALQETSQSLHGDIARALAGAPGARAGAAAIAGLVAFAAAQPAQARFLMNDTLGGGPRALQAREEAIGRIAKLVAKTEGTAEAGAPTADLPWWLILGAVERMLASRLRRGLPGLAGQLEGLQAWIACYETPVEEHRWRTTKAGVAPARSPHVPRGRMRPPVPLSPGRPRLSEQEIAENHRQRLFFAAARLAGERGYNDTTIAAITDRAGLDRRAFYTLFKDKRDAYMAVHEFGFQRLLEVTAGAFFAGESWPERVWEALRGLTQFIQENPTFANVGFVEAHAVGPGAVQRVEDSVSAFTVFLQEGYQYEPRAQTPPRIALEGVVTGVYEVIYHAARAGAGPDIEGLAPLLAFVCLAPFLGQAQANVFIERQRRGAGSAAAKAGTRRAGAKRRARAKSKD